jgi:XapX domain-containing protein
VKEIFFSSGVGFGISALFTLLRLPIPVPNVLPGILSIVFMYIGYLVVKYFMP